MTHAEAVAAFKAANAVYQSAILRGTTADMALALDLMEAASNVLRASCEARLFGLRQAVSRYANTVAVRA